MRVRLLGRFEVEGLVERDLGSRKGRTLLKVLALARGAPVTADAVAEVLWGDDQPARPLDQVGVLVSRLRGVLGPERIVRTDAGYALAADWIDVDELEALARRAAEAVEAGRIGAARAATGAALALARGPVLADEDGPWVESARATVNAELARVRRLAVDAAAAAGDHGAAAALGEQALASDPYDEAVLRTLMESHLAAGRPGSALAAYARARRRLVEDLGVSPTSATEAVYARALGAADGQAPAPPDTPPASDPGPVTVVGRQADLAVLDRALRQAADGGAVLVVVEGEPGMGKTTLVEHWSGRVQDRAVVLGGRCDELGRHLPLQPVVDALVRHLAEIGADEGAAVTGADAEVLSPFLGAHAGLGATVVADSDSARARVFAALVATLDRAGRGRPVVLVIEDVHLAGATTLAWLTFALRRASALLLVATTRPGGGRELEPTHHLRLSPLGRDDVAHLVGEDRADALHRRSGGHPLLLAALAASPDEELPPTAADAVARWAEVLGPDAGPTLRAAAVLGSQIDVDLVARVAARPAVDVLDHLEAAEQAGLVSERGPDLVFRHELVREALVSTTGSARRALIHRRAAEALGARPHPDPLAVAVHARAGGDPGATRWFVTAAERAAARFDLDAAEDHLDSALAVGDDPAAHVARARLRMCRSEFPEAAAAAERAISLGGGAAALEVAGWVAYYQRQYDRARACAEQAAARATDRAVRASALALSGRVRHGSGDLAGALDCLEAAREGPWAVSGVADVWRAQLLAHQGRPAEALEAAAGPLVDPDALAHPWAPLHLRFARVLALGQLGRVAEGLAGVDELDAAVARGGAVRTRFLGPAANLRAWLLRWSGRPEEADQHNLRALELTGGPDAPATGTMAEAYYVALLDLADGCLLREDPAGAADRLDQLAVLDTWSGTMSWHQRHRLGLLRARLALAGGDGPGALALAGAVAEDASARGAGRYHHLAQAVMALAEPSPGAELESAVAGLGRCARLEGWRLVGDLARAYRRPDWAATARAWAGEVAAAAGDHQVEAQRWMAGAVREPER